MAFDWGGFGTFLSGGAQTVGAISSLFGGGGPDGPNGPIVNKPFKGRMVTPGYTFGGGQLTRMGGGAGYGNIRRNLNTLRRDIQPGYGRLTQAVTDQIRNQGSAAVGNLRSSLAQRGLLGASFANDALARVEAEYSQQEAMARAAAFQEEMTATNNIIGQQMELARQQTARELTELGVATQFLDHVNQVQDRQEMMLQQMAASKANRLMRPRLA